MFNLLDNILTDNNRISYYSLQKSGGVGSEGVLNNVEQYALYVAQIVEQQNTSIVGKNIGVSKGT